jgi:hypothetical protein
MIVRASILLLLVNAGCNRDSEISKAEAECQNSTMECAACCRFQNKALTGASKDGSCKCKRGAAKPVAAPQVVVTPSVVTVDPTPAPAPSGSQ